MSATKQHGTPESARVCLIGCTGLLGDIVLDAVRRDPSIVLLTCVDRAADLGNPSSSTPPLDAFDLVVWNCADEAQVPEQLAGAGSTPRVVAIVDDGRAAALWELAPRRTELGSLSPSLLAELIRTGALAAPHGQRRSWPQTQESP